MTMEAPPGRKGEALPRPTGFRRLTPGLLHADRTAESFAGLPEGVTMHGQLLAAFKAAAPRLGLSPRLVHAVDWLFRFTQPQDWGRGGRPIVWPSASMQQESLGLSATRVKAINRALIEAGLITMKDSPNGKRYGRATGGADRRGLWLRPLADRRAACGIRPPGRGGAGRARRDGPAAPAGDDRPQGHRPDPGDGGGIRLPRRGMAPAGPRYPEPCQGAQGATTVPTTMALGVESLERRQTAARERLEAIATRAGSSEAVDSDPLGPENGPHQSTYKANLDPEQDTVIANERCSAPAGPTVPEESIRISGVSGDGRAERR